MEEKVQFSLNFEGVDYTVVSDIDTANLIINDPVAANHFLRTQYPDIFTNKTSGNQNNEDVVTGVTPDGGSELEEIWTRRKPTSNDIEATRLLLSCRHELQRDFDDKKTTKSKLWHKIANTLRVRNFCLGPNGAERCRQKFANLCKAYLSFIKHQKTTGEGAVDLPPFYDEIHLILGSKHKANPQYLEDSMELEQQASNEPLAERRTNDLTEAESAEDSVEPCSGTSKDPVSRFMRSKKRVRPFSKSESVLNEMREDRKQRECEFEFLKSHLTRSAEQKDQFLKILGKIASKKRKEDFDSD